MEAGYYWVNTGVETTIGRFDPTWGGSGCFWLCGADEPYFTHEAGFVVGPRVKGQEACQSEG